MAELADRVPPFLLFLFYCLEQDVVLPIYDKLDLPIITLHAREHREKVGFAYLALQRSKTVAGEETQLYLTAESKLAHIQLGMTAGH